MADRRVQVPIRVRVTPEALASRQDDLERALVAATRRAVSQADRTVADAHGAASVALHPPQVAWTGPAAARVAPDARARAGQRLATLVRDAARDAALTRGTAAPQPGGRATTPQRPWAIRGAVTFQARLGHVFDLYAAVDAAAAADLRAQYADLVTRRWTVTALIVEAAAPAAVDHLAEEVVDSQPRSRDTDTTPSYVYTTDEEMWRRAVALDHTGRSAMGLRRPHGNERRVIGHGPGALLLARGMLLVVRIDLPVRVLSDFAEPDVEQVSQVPLRVLADLVDPGRFTQRFGVGWDAYLAEFADQATTVTVVPVTVWVSVPATVLRWLVHDFVARKVPPDGELFGALLAHGAQGELPDRLQPGQQVDYVYVVLPRDPQRVKAALLRPGARRNATELIALLRQDPQELTWPYQVESFLKRYLGEGSGRRLPELDAFEFLLNELAARDGGVWFGRLFSQTQASGHGTTIILLLRLATSTRYAKDPRVQAAVAWLHKAQRTTRPHEYDVARQQILLDRDPRQRVGGEGSDAPRIVADVAPVYSLVLQRKRIAAAKRAEAQRQLDAVVAEKLKAIFSGADRTEYDQEAFLTRALSEALRRAGITEDDIETFETAVSMRIVKLAERSQYAEQRVDVTYELVERDEDESAWRTIAGSRRTVDYALFEEELWGWAFRKSAATIEFLSKVVSFSAVAVVAWEVGAVALLLELAGGATVVLTQVGIAIALYMVTHRHWTVEGFLTAAVSGYLGAVGFRFIGGFATSLAGRIGTETLTRELLGRVVQVTGAAAAGAVGVGVAKFNEDVVAILLGRREGLSSPVEYLHAMRLGAVLGMAAELVVPYAGSALRGLFREELTSATEAAAQLRGAGVTGPRQWSVLTRQATAAFRKQLGAFLTGESAGPLAEAFARRLDAITEELALLPVRRALQLRGAALTPVAQRGARALAAAARAEEDVAAGELLEWLQRAPADAPRLLEALGRAEAEALTRSLPGLAQLVGKLPPELLRRLLVQGSLLPAARSPRVLELLRSPDAERVAGYVGRSVGPGRAGPEEVMATLERYLAHFGTRSPDEVRAALGASAEILDFELAVAEVLEEGESLTTALSGHRTVRTLREALDAVDISGPTGPTPQQRAEYRRRWQLYRSRGGTRLSEDDYIRFRYGTDTNRLPHVSKRRPPVPWTIRAGLGDAEQLQELFRQAAGHYAEQVIARRIPAMRNTRNFPSPLGRQRVRPDFLAPGTRVVRLNARGQPSARGRTRFSARWIGDSKHLEGQVGVDYQTESFVRLAAHTEERTLVLFVRWRGDFPQPQSLTPFPDFGYELPPQLSSSLITTSLDGLAGRFGVRIRVVSDPSLMILPPLTVQGGP
jgi:hypothetical protein